MSISFFGCENSRWITISEKRIHSISGVSSFKDKWIVVHDNKLNGQPRISLLSETYQLREAYLAKFIIAIRSRSNIFDS